MSLRSTFAVPSPCVRRGQYGSGRSPESTSKHPRIYCRACRDLARTHDKYLCTAGRARCRGAKAETPSDARRHQLVAPPRDLVSTTIACQPGYMTRGRFKQRKLAADRAARVAAESDTRRVESFRDVPLDSDPAPAAPPVRAADGSSFRRPAGGSANLSSRVSPARAVVQSPARATTPWEKKTAQRSDLRRLSEVSNALFKIHRDEAKLLRQRDALINQLRSQGVAWSALAMRTGLSRQALSKRVALADDM